MCKSTILGILVFVEGILVFVEGRRSEVESRRFKRRGSTLDSLKSRFDHFYSQRSAWTSCILILSFAKAVSSSVIYRVVQLLSGVPTGPDIQHEHLNGIRTRYQALLTR